MIPTDKEDRLLLRQCLSGDRRASEEFVRRFSGLIYWSVRNTLILKQVQFTDDDLQDLHNTAFLKMFEAKCKKLRQYKGDKGCTVATWIRTVTVRIMLNHLRKKGFDGVGGKEKRVPLEDLSDLKEDRATPLELLEESEQQRMLQDGMKTLPPRERLFLKLHFEQGLPIPKVAQMMEITPQNAYTIKHRAVQKLKAHVASVMILINHPL